MRHLFTPEGEAALATNLRRQPLLAFDFDGTLAPIVPRPEAARASLAVAARLKTLAKMLPVAIVTGRTVDDVRDRLGFEPDYIVGNHGAEDGLDPIGVAAHIRELEPLRERLRLRSADLAVAGISVEDKGQSIALHYRLARRREQALALIMDLVSSPGNLLRVFAGKMVVNIVPADAPDKARAVQALVTRSGASCAFFAGDDVNDEPVFIAAPPDWLTVRVGRDDPGSRAQFFLDGPNEMAMLLGRMQALLSS